MRVSSAYMPSLINRSRSRRRGGPMVAGRIRRPSVRPSVAGMDRESGCTVENAKRPPGLSQCRTLDAMRSSSGECSARTPIRIFVPPHNALSKRGLAAVSAAHLNLLGSFLSFRPSMRSWDARTFGNWLRVSRFRRATGRTRADHLVYPFVLRYRQHAEFGCHSVIPGTTVDELVQGFTEAREAGGDFCLATHYWEVDAAIKDVLRRFLDYAARFSDVRFVAAEELFS